MELALELRQFTNVLQATLIEFDFLIGHYSARLVPICCIVQTLGHAAEYLEDFLALVVELVSRGDIRGEEQSDRLVQVVDVTESDVNVQAVLLSAIICRENMLFVRLWCGCRTRNLDQFRHLN